MLDARTGEREHMDHNGPINWERGWVAPDGELPLVDDVWLPEPDWLRYGGFGVVTLEEVRAVPSLLLLGEPGSGKSVCLQREHDAVDAAKPDGEETHLVDLGWAHDARDLRERVFEHPKFLAWRAGEGRLSLFLDALDEAKVQIRHVVSLLEEGLEGCDLSRLFLRVACRTADRPTEFETWLSRELGPDGLRTLELAPLRQSEACAMADAWGVDPEAFIAEVINAGAEPLAARPLSLKMLLRLFAAKGRFPSTLGALYRDGLLLMAGEDDDERRALRQLSDTAAFAVAARIAAATVLAGRDVVGDAADSDSVLHRELIGGTEVDRLVAAATDVAVDERAVREVLGTALFTARPGGLGWAHRTFGEYLAACWLAGDRVSDAQVADLLLVDDGSRLTIAPPLRNVAGWLLGMRPSFQERVTSADALVLVHGDPAAVAFEVRRALMPALLDALDDQEIDPRELRSKWKRIRYEGISEDLAATVAPTVHHEQTRHAVVDAIGELELVDLAPTLVGIAVDPSESVHLRTSALYALRTFDDLPLEPLRTLALDPQPGDIDDEIKGAALHLCWPAAVTAQELFAALTPKKNPSLIGAYAAFLHGPCIAHLTAPDDLLLGIRWGLTLPRRWHDTSDLMVVAETVVARAWPLAASVPAIAEALADLVVLVTPDFMPVLTSPRRLRRSAQDGELDDPDANAAIVTVLVERVAGGVLTDDLLTRAILRGLAREIDMKVVIERWAWASTRQIKAAWEPAIAALARGDRADAIFAVKDDHPELYALVAWRYEPILLDSAQAEALREEYVRYELDPPAPPAVGPEDLDRMVRADLAAFAVGDVAAFWRMLRPLLAEDDGDILNLASQDDLRSTPGWRRLDDHGRADLTDAALDYLRRGDPDPEQWLGRPVIHYPAYAGYCALKLLFNERRAEFDRLDAAAWRVWAPVIVTQRRLGEDNDADEFGQAVMERVRAQAPDVARETVLAVLPSYGHASEIVLARARLGDVWDASLDDALGAQLDRDDLELQHRITVVEALLKFERQDAIDWAVARITTAALIQDGEDREQALALAQALAVHAPRILGERIEAIADEDEQAVRTVLASLLDRESGWETRVAPATQGRLFGLLHRLFPRDLDSQEERSFAVTTEMRASFSRTRILEALVAKGTQEAVAVIADIEEQHDGNGWIRRMRHRAQEEVRRAIWAPPASADVVRMGGVDDRRHVPDAPALRRLVIRELAGIADAMQGASSLAPFLWNTRSPHRPPRMRTRSATSCRSGSVRASTAAKPSSTVRFRSMPAPLNRPTEPTFWCKRPPTMARH